MLGSCVWKPGDRHAKPTSCIPRLALALSLAVNGADGLEDIPAWALLGVLDVRSNLLGRCRAVAGTSGEGGGSFLTIIFGG